MNAHYYYDNSEDSYSYEDVFNPYTFEDGEFSEIHARWITATRAVRNLLGEHAVQHDDLLKPYHDVYEALNVYLEVANDIDALGYSNHSFTSNDATQLLVETANSYSDLLGYFTALSPHRFNDLQERFIALMDEFCEKHKEWNRTERPMSDEDDCGFVCPGCSACEMDNRLDAVMKLKRALYAEAL